jgi:hypothetical protein
MACQLGVYKGAYYEGKDDVAQVPLGACHDAGSLLSLLLFEVVRVEPLVLLRPGALHFVGCRVLQTVG